MLASHGFVVAVPEIYHELESAGTVLAYDEAGAERGAGLSEVLTALHRKAGRDGDLSGEAFGVSCGDAA